MPITHLTAQQAARIADWLLNTETDEFKNTYRCRAGIEGTHSQGVRTMGLRRSRSIGLHKTHLGHVAIATAVNVIQLMSWLRGEAPEQTRTSAFKRVMEQAV